ncbi:hypothetical protein M0C91_04580 [Methanoculleus sp. 7T]|nr:hypothetical protein [Methanoculleus sp. 7T]
MNPCAVRAMAEIGIDVSGHRSKGLGEFDGQEMDYLVTVCEEVSPSRPRDFGATLFAGIPAPAYYFVGIGSGF